MTDIHTHFLLAFLFGITIEYQILHNNMQLRKIVREEVQGLVEDITPDCVSALMCIQNRSECGATYPEIEEAVRGDDDTKDAVRILNDHKLICIFRECYFTTVSRRTIEIFSDVVREKRRYEANNRFSVRGDSHAVLERLFDVLFDDR